MIAAHEVDESCSGDVNQERTTPRLPHYPPRLYARAQTALLKAGITHRWQLRNYDKEQGIRGVLNIGKVLTALIESLRGLPDAEFAKCMPGIAVELHGANDS